MPTAVDIVRTLIAEGIAARAHFQIWWVLRNKALPEYADAMNHLEYVDFFHASNSGHYKLFLLALAKIYDRDDRVAGLKSLGKALGNEGHSAAAEEIQSALDPHRHHISAICAIRDRTLAHNEADISRNKVYKVNGITPNEISELIDATCETINRVARELGVSNTIFESRKAEEATFALLAALQAQHLTQFGGQFTEFERS